MKDFNWGNSSPQTFADLQKENNELKQRLARIQQKYEALLKDQKRQIWEIDPMEMPDDFFIYDSRVNWVSLRDTYHLELDDSISEYHHAALNRMQEQQAKLIGRGLLNATAVTSIGINSMFLPNCPVLLDENARELLTVGLVPNIPVNKILKRFYISHFCSLPITEFRLPTKVQNTFKILEVSTIGEVTLLTPDQISSVHYAGSKTLGHIHYLLEQMGLVLGMTADKLRAIYEE